MFGVVPKTLWEKEERPDPLNRIAMTTRCLLVSGEGRNVIIDPGMGAIWNAKSAERYALTQPAPDLEESLSAHGLTPDDVTDVFLTHLHFDHIGGCFHKKEGQLRLRFPRSRHHIQAAQWDWAQAPSAKDLGSYIPEWLELLERSKQLVLHEGSYSLMPGFSAFTVEGHTTGQQLCRLETSKDTYVYGGDLFPLTAHLRLPWLMAYDIEPLETLKAKTRVIEEHLGNGESLIFGHDCQTAAARLDLSGKYPKPVDVGDVCTSSYDWPS